MIRPGRLRKSDLESVSLFCVRMSSAELSVPVGSLFKNRHIFIYIYISWLYPLEKRIYIVFSRHVGLEYRAVLTPVLTGTENTANISVSFWQKSDGRRRNQFTVRSQQHESTSSMTMLCIITCPSTDIHTPSYVAIIAELHLCNKDVVLLKDTYLYTILCWLLCDD